MPLYDAPIWSIDEERFPPTGFSGAGWKLLAPEVPFEEGEVHQTKHFRRMRRKYPEYSTNQLLDRGRLRIAPQILIEARNRITAQRAFVLVQASLAVIDGHAAFEIEDSIVVPSDRRRLEDLTEYDVMGRRATLFRATVSCSPHVWPPNCHAVDRFSMPPSNCN